MEIAGIDLAWNGASNPSAVATGSIIDNKLIIREIVPAILGMNQIVNFLFSNDGLHGIAVDASLIINNKTGRRPCEAELSRMYASRWASCHPTNENLYPDAFSVRLAEKLGSEGFEHMGRGKWMIECYPHASIIEIFGLAKRLLYKKGAVADKKKGQKKLSAYILKLSEAPGLPLIIPEHVRKIFDPVCIELLKGQSLKSNEDALDAVICLYTAGLYAINARGITFGDTRDGYIWVPQEKCI
jgi:predicted RNase H-like nuclease